MVSTSAQAWWAHEGGAVDQPSQAVSGIAGQPGVQGLARHPELSRHHDLGFTALDCKDRTVALLDNRHLHQSHSRPPPPPSIQDSERKADQARCQASGETATSSIRRDNTALHRVCCRIALYEIKVPLARPDCS